MPKRNETLSFTTSFMGANRASASTIIVDTSYPMTYTSKWSTTAAGTATITETDEGKDVYFVIDSDNVPDGTRGRVIIVSLGNSDTAAGVADFDDYVYSTDVVMSGGKAAVKVSIKADQLTENRESFYAALLNTEGGVLTSASLYINDTSKTPAPTYKIGWYSNSAGTTSINTINEGSTAWLNVSGANIPNGTVVTVKLSGTGINANDFTDNLIQKDIVIQNNTGRVSFSLTNDLTTEGVETIIGTAFVGGVNIGSTNLTINDTSLTPRGTIFEVGVWEQSSTLKHYGYGEYSTTNFGREISDELLYQGVFVGLAYCTFTDIDTGGITINISNDSSLMTDASFKLKLTNLTTGTNITTNQFTPGMSIPGSTVWQSTLDATSRTKAKQMFVIGQRILVEMIELTPTYNIGWYSSSAGTTPINIINEGSTAWLIINTTNVANGAVVECRVSGGVNAVDFTDGVLNRNVTISSNVGRTSFPISADNTAEGNETLTVSIYVGGVYKAQASITIIDTSKETVITIPNEYNGKGVILVELFKKILKRSPNSDEHVRVVVPSNIELQAFPRVVGRRWIRSEQAPGAVLATPIYDDTFYPAQHGISLVGMPSPGLVTVDVYGKIIGGPVRLKYGYDPKNADNTFTHNFPYSYSASADRIMVANDQTGILIAPLPNPTQTLGFAIYSPVVFNLIVRNGAMVVGHGGEIPNMWGYLQDYNWATGKYEYVTEVKDNRGGDAIYIDSMEGNMRVNVIGNGVLAGGGGSGGNGGGLLSIGMTHWDLGSLATYYGAYGGGGAPYGGCIYHHDGATSDPVCPVAYRRVGSVTGGRRLGDTGTYGVRSVYSGGSATLTQGGSVGPRFQFGPNGKGYHFDFTPGVGGGIGQRGQAGSTPIYKEYQWSPNKVYTFTAEERTATSAPGPSGTIVKMAVLNGTVTYDSSLT